MNAQAGGPAGAGRRRHGRPRIALVLGAGGEVGQAFHAGVLRALHEATGWDPQDAEVIVGTSAGSIAGAMLRAGMSPRELADRVGGRWRPDTERARRAGPPLTAPSRPRFGYAGAAAPRLLLRGATRPWTVSPGAVVAAALPRGRVSLEPVAARMRALHDGHWPDRPLWITAVSLDTGRREVFGRAGAPDVDIGTAVAASCAIPAWFQPVRVGTAWYVDGGAHSVTNLDVVAGMGLDLVVVSAPMAVARGAWRPAAELTARGGIRLRLRQEAARVRRGGTEVVAFSPTSRDLDVMGTNAMDGGRRAAVAEAAYESAGRRLVQPSVRTRLSALFPVAP